MSSLEKTSDVAIEHGHEEHAHHHHHKHDVEADPQHLGDEEFGGHEARKKLEKRLLWKLDARMSILIVIYILNYVRVLRSSDQWRPLMSFSVDRS